MNFLSRRPTSSAATMFKHILMTPASNGRHVLGESAVIDWLHGA